MEKIGKNFLFDDSGCGSIIAIMLIIAGGIILAALL